MSLRFGVDPDESQRDEENSGPDEISVRRFWLTWDGRNGTIRTCGKFDLWLRSRPKMMDIFPKEPEQRSVEPKSMNLEYFIALLEAVVGA